MPWSGSSGSQVYGRSNGVYTGTQVWQQDSGAGTKITSPLHDVHDQDIATALNLCLKKDGGNSASADIPMGGNKLTNVGNAAALSQYVSGTQAMNGSFLYVPTVGGTGDVITLTTGWTLAAYASGQKFRFINSGGPNTTAVTVNVDTLGAKAVVRNDGSYTALSAGDLPDNAFAEIVYDGTRFILVAGSGYTPGGTDVAVADGGTGASTAAGARTNLGLAIGTDVQAYAANLTTWAGLAPSANVQTFVGAADYAAMRTQMSLVYASVAEQVTGSSTTRVVAPGTQVNHRSAIKAWGNVAFDGTLASGSFNVSGVSVGGGGFVYTITLSNAMSGTGYAVLTTNTGLKVSRWTVISATQFSITTYTPNNVSGSPDGFSFAVLGDLA